MREGSYRILLSGGWFSSKSDEPRTRRSLLYLLEAMVNMNQDYLRSYPHTPALYESGVVYRDDPRPRIRDERGEEYPVERWDLIPDVLLKGGSDCKNLASWRCAELRQQGVRCRPYFEWKTYGPDFTLLHVLVQFPVDRAPNGDALYDESGIYLPAMEDPSKILGMGRERQWGG